MGGFFVCRYAVIIGGRAVISSMRC